MTRLITNVASICSCSLDSDDLLNSQLQCFDESANTVTFRTQLTGTNEASTSELVSALEEWTSLDDSFLVDGVRLSFNTTCPLLVSNFNTEECPNTVATAGPLTEGPISITLIVSVILGVLLLVSLVLNVILICCCACWRSRGSKESYDVREEQNGQEVNPYVYNRNDQQRP